MKGASSFPVASPQKSLAQRLWPRRSTDSRLPLPPDAAVAAFAVTGISAHLILRYVTHSSAMISNTPLIAVIAFGGIPLLIVLGRKCLAKEFGSDLLAGISITVAAIQGEYLVGTIIVLMLSGGAALEEFSSRRASSVLDALAKRMPQNAHRRVDDRAVDVKLEDIRVGDALIVYPHEICPTDGVVIEGQGRMNEAFLTGEPYEMSKAPGSAVISGALNGEAALTIRVEKLPVDSRYARIMRVMEETQQRRPRLRRLGDQLGAWYTPIAVTLAVLAWIATGQSRRFLSVLVIATPCPLLLAIPVAVIGAISLSARRGIIVKNPAILEQIPSCRTFIFDKTGTLTYGRASLTGTECAPGVREDEALQTAASAELFSKHPLARAIVEAAEQRGLSLKPVSEIHEPPGAGLRGVVDGRAISIVGRRQLSASAGLPPPVHDGLECVMLVDGRFAALFRFRDVPRRGARSFLEHLAPRHGVTRLILVSGDRPSEVAALAAEMGIQEVHASKEPGEKVEIVRAETASGHVAFVGDGINDAPAMQAATIGIALGQTSDIVTEAADAVLLDNSLSKVDELIHIGRRMRRIALESSVGGMGLSVIGMALAAIGLLRPIEGAIAQEVIDLLAVLNAVRTSVPTNHLTDF
ncbi:MAG TPA: heavy metal translocating P-type ATPase [Verrucomicrobiae bacterium]|nr:heavy metal translocating P-type ATPase [Verrucomicrobiae bacterium]